MASDVFSLGPVIWKNSVSSTNSWMLERLAGWSDPPFNPGTVVAAREQTHGRGREGRTWQNSGPGNLSASVYLPLDVPGNFLPSLSLCAALAVARYLEPQGLEPVLKWPNDVLVQGAKICGILCELAPGAKRPPWPVVLGLGLNVNMDANQAGGVDRPATSLYLETGQMYDVGDVLAHLLVELEQLLPLWSAHGYAGIQREWESLSFIPEGEISIQVAGRTLRGHAMGLGKHGQLQLRDEQGEIMDVWAGDTSMRPTALE